VGVLRFLLAVSVAIFHGADFFCYKMVNGYHAVTIFFMISGFYMTLVLNEKYTSYIPFIYNRLLKILPAYWVVVIICHILNPINFSSLPFSAEIYYVFSNVFILFSQFTAILMQDESGQIILASFDRTPFAVGAWTWRYLYIGPVWSLSVELMFYLMAPFIVKIRSGYLLRVAAVSAISLSAWLIIINQDVSTVPWAYNFLLPNLVFFMLGSLSYWLFYHGGLTKLFPPNQWVCWVMLLVSVTACVFYSMIPTTLKLEGTSLSVSNVFFLGAVFFICMPYIFELSKWSRADQYIGNLSYPIYIVHFLVLNHLPFDVPYIKPIFLIILLAVVIHHLVMLPIERKARRAA
jgi:peptidoglycan/LPS O-acetylase OafA/YrhL